MSGYPEESIVKRGEKEQARFFMYSMTGNVELVEQEGDHMIAAHSIDSTPGQDGGPLTMNDGTVVGIFSNVEEYGADSYYMV